MILLYLPPAGWISVMWHVCNMLCQMDGAAATMPSCCLYAHAFPLPPALPSHYLPALFILLYIQACLSTFLSLLFCMGEWSGWWWCLGLPVLPTCLAGILCPACSPMPVILSYHDSGLKRLAAHLHFLRTNLPSFYHEFLYPPSTSM